MGHDHVPLDVECVRRQIHDYHVPEHRKDILAKSEALDQEMAELEKLREQLQQKELKTKQSSVALGKSLVAFAGTDCRALATSFHAAMPREIRDCVYSYLQPESLDVGQTFPLVCPGEIEFAMKTFQDLLQHWFFPEFVGFDFAHECAKNQFEKTIFLFDANSIMTIKVFLNVDIWRLKLHPIDHIRRCRIDIITDQDFQSGGMLLSRDEQDQLNELCRLKHASCRVDFILRVYASDRQLPRLYGLLTHLIWLLPVLFNFRRWKISFTVKFMIRDDEGSQAEITYMWTHKAGKQGNGNLDAICQNDQIYKALQQRFGGWKKALMKVFDPETDFDNPNIKSLESSGIMLENKADYRFLSHLVLTDFDPNLTDLMAIDPADSTTE